MSDPRLTVRAIDGKHFVCLEDQTVSGPHDTNAAAWRALDRMNGEPISNPERITAWLEAQP